MFCKNCGQQLNDNAKFCISCGTKIENSPQPPISGNQSMTQGQAEPTSQEEPILQAEPKIQEQPTPQEQSVPQGQSISQSQPMSQGQPMPQNNMQNTQYYAAQNGVSSGLGGDNNKKGKKHSALAVKILIPVAALAVIAIGVLNASAFINYFKSSFSSPKQYFNYIATKESEKYSTYMAKSYDSYKKALDNSLKSTAKSGVKLEFSSELVSTMSTLLTPYLGYNDFSNFKSIGADLDYTLSPTAIMMTGKVNANDRQVIGGKAIIDRKGYYLEVPDLNPNALYVNDEYGYMGLSRILDSISMMQSRVENMPNSEIVQNIITRYLKIIIDNTNQIEKGSDEISAGSIKQKATLLKLTYTESDLMTIAKTMANEALADKDLEALINALDPYNSSYNELINAMHEIINANTEYTGKLYICKLWVNKTGNIIGFEFESQEDNSGLFFKTAIKGGDLGFEAGIFNYNSQVASISGSGKISGANISGKYSLHSYNEVVASFDIKSLDVLALIKDSSIKCKMDISSPMIDKQIYENSYDSVYRGLASIIANCKMGINIDAKPNSGKAVIEVKRADTPLVSLSMSTGFTSPEKIVIPSTTSPLEQWVFSLNTDKLTKNLRGILPDTLLDNLENVGGIGGLITGLYY